MQAKLNIVLKIAEELGLAAKAGSSLREIANMTETDRLRIGVEDLIETYGVNEDLCDKLIQSLNEVKKKRFELKILESGKSIDSVMELRDLKSRGVNNLINIPVEIRAQVSNLESQIALEKEHLVVQRKKSKETIVEENNLLPNLNFRVGLSLLLTLFSTIFIILGYVASTDERFYDRDFGYWSMLLGGLAFLITLNLLVIRIVQAVRFQMNKRQAIEDLAAKYLNRLESDFEILETQTRNKIFALESVVYSQECRRQAVESNNEINKPLSQLAEYFN